MELAQAIRLIKHQSIFQDHKTEWADLGCGKGLFAIALAELLQPESKIYAVDKSGVALKHLPSFINNVFIEKRVADFVKDPLHLTSLDGILMANSLHFVSDKQSWLQQLLTWLKPTGLFLIVEYDTDRANPWVPFPISFSSLSQLFLKMKLTVEKIGEQPSVYNPANIYSAIIQL